MTRPFIVIPFLNEALIMQANEKNIGLNDFEVSSNRKLHGTNKLLLKEKSLLVSSLLNTMSEPMFIILLLSSGIYFYTDAFDEGILMIVSIILVSGISFYQEYRSKNSIHALKKMTVAKAIVIRNNVKQAIHADEIVVQDVMLIEEGDIIPADGEILSSNDLLINESVLTGESLSVVKSKETNNNVYRGTLVSSGSATVKVTKVGNETELGKIGKSLEEISIEKTPLQLQIKSFVTYMVFIGAIAFILVVFFNYMQTKDLVAALMSGLTLSMSILPEEIPVAFATFQALGAFRLLKKNKIIVKQPQYVETLGTATVICADKTGTLTENEMSIAKLYDFTLNKSLDTNQTSAKSTLELIEWAMWSSEEKPFDPMEKAIHQLYEQTHLTDQRKKYKQVHEYPLSGKPPIMTHVFKKENTNELIVAVKGGAETLLQQCELTNDVKSTLEQIIKSFAKSGLRVIGIGKSTCQFGEWPKTQDEFIFQFLGLIAFKDPPKKNIKESISIFHRAGIQFKMITGDYAETAVAIAKEINIKNPEEVITGDQIQIMQREELKNKIKQVNVFARMFPDAKLKIIEALKANGEITAMTGDGVNDGPALKAAHIGIAMGTKGTEVAKNAASLIIIDNDLSHMTDAIELGRRIYDNLTKAVQYIISIHIPIILIVLLGSFFHFTVSPIFSPVHVIFLELIMGPTCSIIYENEPVEKGTMLKPPRNKNVTFLAQRQLMMSIVQGLMITSGCLFSGYYLNNNSDNTMRTAVFFSLLCSNIFLTLFNRSRYYSVITTFKYKNHLLPVMILISVIFMVLIQTSPLGTSLFELRQLTAQETITCIGISFLATVWFEGYKWIKRRWRTN